jgi:predicted kinase
MSPIFLLVGAPAVGKSTTAHALAEKFQKSVHIPVDDLREMVVSGLFLPGPEWGQELIEQITLARESAMQMAINYSKAGFAVVIDDFWDTLSQLREYDHLLDKSNFHRVLLFPAQQAAEARNKKRDGSPYIADGIRIVYEQLKKDFPDGSRQGWLVLDTTQKNVEETVAHILTQTLTQK